MTKHSKHTKQQGMSGQSIWAGNQAGSALVSIEAIQTVRGVVRTREQLSLRQRTQMTPNPATRTSGHSTTFQTVALVGQLTADTHHQLVSYSTTLFVFTHNYTPLGILVSPCVTPESRGVSTFITVLLALKQPCLPGMIASTQPLCCGNRAVLRSYL